MALYKNITGSGDGTITDLIARGNRTSGGIRSILITNYDGKAAIDVSVFIEDATAAVTTNAGNKKFYYCDRVDIPVGAGLLLDHNVGFNAQVFSLRIKTYNDADGGAPSLSIIIK
tara:strand:+ start:67 stop:411 length:345 start_codon:yes stop_codon:yes gene_type:complete